MRVAITGSSGLIGTALRESLSARGHRVIRVLRRAVSDERGAVSWDPEEPAPLSGLNGVDAVVHLAGEEFTRQRWSWAQKERISLSRFLGTRHLAEALATLEQPPEVLVSASAVGFYGNTGGEPVDENTLGGTGFLANVCYGWEAATHAARTAGIRVVRARFGVVLSRRGGVLPPLASLFRAGLGGRLGSGEQVISWVHLDDAIGALHHIFTQRDLSGPVNVVSPRPVTHRRFAQVMARVLRRPAVLVYPEWVLRLALGELAAELLLTGQAVTPRRLTETGFRPQHPQIEEAVSDLLGPQRSKGIRTGSPPRRTALALPR